MPVDAMRARLAMYALVVTRFQPDEMRRANAARILAGVMQMRRNWIAKQQMPYRAVCEHVLASLVAGDDSIATAIDMADPLPAARFGYSGS